MTHISCFIEPPSIMMKIITNGLESEVILSAEKVQKTVSYVKCVKKQVSPCRPISSEELSPLFQIHLKNTCAFILPQNIVATHRLPSIRKHHLLRKANFHGLKNKMF